MVPYPKGKSPTTLSPKTPSKPKAFPFAANA